MPIHAATEFGDDGQVLSRLSDKVVSSYIPTISTLLEPKRTMSHSVDCNVLSIIQPATPGQDKLPRALEELKKITQRGSDANITSNAFKHDIATVDAVLGALPEYSVVHFSCHGVQDLSDPLNSGLLLYDGRLTLSKLMHIRLPNAQLAFLSAGETAQGEGNYPDEAVHVAAGFRDVIGTMWIIHDNSAPVIADLVYAEVFKDGKLLVDRIPFALHNAVKHLRNQRPNDFMSWIPFIHLGP